MDSRVEELHAEVRRLGHDIVDLVASLPAPVRPELAILFTGSGAEASSFDNEGDDFDNTGFDDEAPWNGEVRLK